MVDFATARRRMVDNQLRTSNVTDRAAAIKEARRVLKPGGRFYCLELSKVVGC